MSRSLSASQARRIALAAQGLAGPRPQRPVTRRAFRALARRLAVLQLDSVNVMVRTHYMPTFSRLGGYASALLESEAWGKRPSLFEYWGHQACLMPVDMQPLFRWRMRGSRRKDESKTAHARLEAKRPGYIDWVLQEIGRRGPVTGGDFADEGPRKSGWWEWSDGKIALEWLFWTGRVAIKTRRGFERVYDLTERVLPPEVLNAPTPSEAEAKRELVRIAVAALGIATAADVADYFMLLQADVRAAAKDLVEAGALEPVSVKGWGPAWLAAGAWLPRRASAAALLSPFDNLIFNRGRTERLFGLRYRIGLYTPADQRHHGYYVYPFLMDERIAAQVDLKADRAAGRLLVQAAHLEAGAAEDETAERLAGELRLLAAWQGLPDIAVSKKGGLAAALCKKIG
jgi:uncharacterized protein YcaQ